MYRRKKIAFFPKRCYNGHNKIRRFAESHPEKSGGIAVNAKEKEMTETSFSYSSCDQKHTLAATLFLPEKEPRALFQIVHGVAEHVGRYRRFAEFLTAQGFLVFGENHLGHGPGVEKAERGFFGEENGWDTVARDSAALSEEMRARYPGLPFVLFGHSMGSFLVRTIYLRALTKPDAVILSGTGNMSKAVIFAGKLTAKRELARLGSKQCESPLLDRLVFGSYNKRFSQTPGGNDWITSLPEELARYDEDPDCGFKIKLGMFMDLFDGLSFIVSKKNIRQADKEIPLLLLAGKEDPVGARGKGVRAAGRAFRRAGVRDVTIRLYEGCRHEILNDSCRTVVEQDILTWLKKRLAF